MKCVHFKSAKYIKDEIGDYASLRYYNGGCHQVFANSIDLRDIAVLSVACDYKSMVRFGETVKIYLSITSLSDMKMTVAYRIVDINCDELRAIGETKHFFYNNKKSRPVSLKRELPKLYEIFEAIVTEE